MKDGGRTDYWAPDSSLDREEPGVWYQDSEGKWFNVCVNDFADLDESIPEDPLWGSSFQVLELRPTEIIVRMYNAEQDLYKPVAVSIQQIINNYARAIHVDVLPIGAITL